ncbi:MAG: acyltransferase domain-containing protein, partial [Anaerolineales bacterium]|nr:acyltransferase domain-containing protein [Anaerolineales bacterium]
FGFGGTNFHFALEEYTPEHQETYRLHKTPETIFLSAPTPAQLIAKCERELGLLRSETGQTHYRELIAQSQTPTIPTSSARLGFVADSLEQVITNLETAATLLKKSTDSPNWEHPKGIFYRQSGIASKGKVVALFPGQGSQYLEMGKELALNFPPIREAYGQMDKLFVSDGQPPLTSVLFPIPVFTDEEKQSQSETLRRTEFVQPAIGAFSVGLYKLLQAAGFSPDFTAGHSFGELTALWAGGVIDDDTYFYLAKARGQAMAAPGGPTFDAGTMVAIKGDLNQLQIDLQGLDGVTVANYNSTEQVVLAGSKPAMKATQQHLANKGYVVTPLSVSAAFHTPFVGHAQQPFAQAIARTQFKTPRIPVYSNSTAQPYDQQPEVIQASLKEHILNPVYFSQEIENIYAAGGAIFVEIGPKRVLTTLVKDILSNRPHVAVALNASTTKGSDRQLREAYVQLCVAGLPLRALDTYSLEFDATTSDKKSIINVSIAGNNYVSPQTQTEYEEALHDGQTITAAPAAVAAPTPPPAKPAPPQRASTPPSPPPAPAKTAAANGNGRPPAPAPKPQPKERQKSMSDSSEFQKQIEKSLELLHQHQAETARVHETFLKGQEAYAQSIVQLMQSVQGVSNGHAVAKQPAPAPTPQPVAPQPPVMPSKPSNNVSPNGGSNGVSAANAAAKPAAKVAPPPAPAPTPKPVTPPPPVQQAPPAPQPTPQPAPMPTPVAPAPAPAPQANGISTELEQAMLDVVSEKTGYPVEMLEMHM